MRIYRLYIEEGKIKYFKYDYSKDSADNINQLKTIGYYYKGLLGSKRSKVIRSVIFNIDIVIDSGMNEYCDLIKSDLRQDKINSILDGI